MARVWERAIRLDGLGESPSRSHSRRILTLTLLRSPDSSPTSSGRLDRRLVCLVPLARLDRPLLTTCESPLLVPQARLPTDAQVLPLSVTRLFLPPLEAPSMSIPTRRFGERCPKASYRRKTCRWEVHGGREPLAYSWGHLQNSSYHHRSGMRAGEESLSFNIFVEGYLVLE